MLRTCQRPPARKLSMPSFLLSLVPLISLALGPWAHHSLLVAALAESTSAAPRAAAVDDEDPYLWLEDVTGTKALDWVSAQNARSLKELGESAEFTAMSAGFLEILDSKAKIPTVEKLGGHYYNFWRDQDHERGLWRRTTLAEYRQAEPKWETVLDLDELSRTEGVNWAWMGAIALPPEYRRCLVHLSRGGADAVEVRELDLTQRAFVANGFRLAEAKTRVAWRDRDAIFVATDFGPGSLTTSGYPRIIKEWRRATPLSAATMVYEGRTEDVSVTAFHEHTPGFERDLVLRSLTYFTHELFVRRDGRMVKIEKPDDADAMTHGRWLLIRLRTDWTAGGRTWPAGALLVTPFDAFLAGARELTALFEPTPHRSLDSYSTMRDAILLNELDNVRNRLVVARYVDGVWTRSPVEGLPEFGTVGADAVDPLESNDYWLTITDFLTPTSFSLGTLGGQAPEKLKQLPAFFDTTGLAVSQHDAVSKDGTRVPYFQVSRQGLEPDGTAPTLLTGYGGFEIPMLARYDPMAGRGWLEKGGVLVVANIHGGGEFGPEWHAAAKKANRPRAYEDFIAVGEDLARRKVTSPRHLACMGRSNGGLLVGNMLALRPDLFRAIVCQAPLLDMKRYHKLLAGASWMDEYGNPDLPEEWAFVQKFSPYHLVRPGVDYPRTLFMTSTRDDRVHPGHARKMMAVLEALGNDVLFYENVEGGHSGAATNRQSAIMAALAYRFLWQELQPSPSGHP